MQTFIITVLTFLSVITITAHPLTPGNRNPGARARYPLGYWTRSVRRLAARGASPFNFDDIRQGAHHTMDHVRHATNNQTVAVTEQAHKYTPTLKEYEPGVEAGACAIGAFLPVVDIAIDSACLALVAVKGGHAVYKHAHNQTHTATHAAQSHTSDPSHQSNSPVALDATHHPDSTGNPEPPEHSGASQYRRDREIRNVHAYWDSS